MEWFLVHSCEDIRQIWLRYTEKDVWHQPNCTLCNWLQKFKTNLHVICTQVEMSWRLRQKLTVMIRLSIHTMMGRLMVCLFISDSVFSTFISRLCFLFMLLYFISALATSEMWCLGTNLIHDFTAVSFSVKLSFFREKCPFSWNPWFFVNFNTSTFICEGFQSFINSFCAHFAVCYMSHFSTK